MGVWTPLRLGKNIKLASMEGDQASPVGMTGAIGGPLATGILGGPGPGRLPGMALACHLEAVGRVGRWRAGAAGTASDWTP